MGTVSKASPTKKKHRLLRQDSFQDAPSSQTALFFEKNLFKAVNSREKK